MPKAETSATALDTNVIVAALQSWHEDHAAARASLQRVLASEELVLLPSRVLLESFSVMTRMPAPHRLDPNDALTLLEETLKDSTRLIDLPAEEYWTFLRDLTERGAIGGVAYDAEIVECARRVHASTILTFNRRHFERLAPEGISIVVPTDESTAEGRPTS